jgi:hypothetical protein
MSFLRAEEVAIHQDRGYMFKKITHHQSPTKASEASPILGNLSRVGSKKVGV